MPCPFGTGGGTGRRESWVEMLAGLFSLLSFPSEVPSLTHVFARDDHWHGSRPDGKVLKKALSPLLYPQKP